MIGPRAGRPGGRRVDLHTHTRFSDGLLTPEALVALAIERGLTALAITDHDAIDGIGPARAAAGHAIEIVPAIEISSALDGVEMHVLGYYVDPEEPALRERLERFRADRLERALAMVERLRELGAAIDPQRVLALAGPGVVGRPHVAEALVEAGHCLHLEDAFRRYLGHHGAAFVPRPAFATREAIALIHAAGGLSVLAHAGGAFEEAKLERLVDWGLRGLEIWHPQHGASAIRRLRGLAQRFDLIETGGSDFHGIGRGTDLGGLPVPAGVLQRLKDAAGVAG
jgi:3',5'-nucleoside bisphosphate phosphatase